MKNMNICVVILLTVLTTESVALIDNDYEAGYREIRTILFKQQEEIRELKKISLVQEKKLRSLENENEALRRNVDELNAIVLKLEASRPTTNPSDDINSVSNTSSLQTRQIDHSGESLFSNGKRLTTSTSVAFYAYMSTSENAPSNHHTLVFDVIKTNIGGGYNKHSGMFSAPVAGVYVLTWTIYSGDNGKTVFGIFVNDDMVCSTFGETNDVDYDYDSDTGVIVVSLNQYDDVFIRSIMTCSTNIVSFAWNTRTTFAGWKLD